MNGRHFYIDMMQELPGKETSSVPLLPGVLKT